MSDHVELEVTGPEVSGVTVKVPHGIAVEIVRTDPPKGPQKPGGGPLSSVVATPQKGRHGREALEKIT